MKLLSPSTWLKSASTEVKSRSMTLGTSHEMGSFLMFGTAGHAASPASALRLYDRSSAVSIPINRIASAIADLNIVIEDEDGVIENNHPALDLIRKPGAYFTKELFLETLAKNFLITGELQVVGIGGIARPPIELQPISPDKITVPKGQDGLPTSLIVSGETMPGQYPAIRQGSTVRFLRDNLTEIHMTRNFRTRDNSLLRGQSLLLSASSEVRQHILGGQHNVSLLEKGGNVSMVFHFAQDMNDDDFQEAKQRVRAQYGGASKAGEIGVTAGDGALDIKTIGSKNKDMDFANLQKMAKVAIASQYNFPLVLLDTDAATFNNYSTAKEALYDDAVLPTASIILGGLSNFLMPRFGEDPTRLKFSIDFDSIPALQMRRNRELKIRKDIGIETMNELRGFLPNRDDVDNGDTILIPGNLVPLGFEPDMMDENPPMDVGADDGE